MKNYTLILCMFLLSGCLNNDFMERYPLGNPTAETAFVSYDNFKAYAWGLYETFPALGYGSENATDDISYNQTRETSETGWIRGIVTVPDKKENNLTTIFFIVMRLWWCTLD